MERQADRQIARQSHTHTHIQRERERERQRQRQTERIKWKNDMVGFYTNYYCEHFLRMAQTFPSIIDFV